MTARTEPAPPATYTVMVPLVIVTDVHRRSHHFYQGQTFTSHLSPDPAQLTRLIDQGFIAPLDNARQ